MDSPSLILIDDEPAVCEYIERVARLCGFSVQAAQDAQTFKQLVETSSPDVIVIDLCMPGCDGVELLSYLAELPTPARVIVMSGVDRRVLDTAERLGRARGLNMAGAVSKPMRAAELRRCLLNAAETVSR